MTDLIRAIYIYRSEWNSYLAASLDDDDEPFTYKPALEALERWDRPAESAMEASEAARLALEFYKIGDSEVIPAMLGAISGFFQAGAPAKPEDSQ